ncbi:MAG: lactonase family protein [Pseudoxanthomonas sp.]
MRRSWLALLLWPALALHAHALDLLAGSYTVAGGPGVYVLRFDPASGHIEPAPAQSAVLGNPSWLVPGKAPGVFYAIDENGPGAPDPVGRATRISLDPQRRIKVNESASTLSDEPTHGTLSPDGRYLLVANYAVAADPGGLLAVLPLDAEGRLRPVTQVASYQASHVDAERQASSHIHSVNFTPDGRHVLVADLGGDRVYVYDYDPDASAERPLRPAAVPFLQLPAGSGPRHLVFDRDGRHAWLTLEMAGQVAQLDWDGRALSLRALHDLAEPVLPRGAANGGGALHLSPDGRFLYAINRGRDNRIAVFAVAVDGGLRLLQRRSAEGPQAREFAFSPDGRFLLVAVQGGDRIAVIRRDPRSGRLGETVSSVALHAPSWLGFLPH